MSVNIFYYADWYFKYQVLVICLQYVRYFQCLIKQYVTKECGRSPNIAQFIINLDTRWEWSAWFRGGFNTRDIATCTDWIIGWIGLSAGLALPESKHFFRQRTSPQTAEMKGPNVNVLILVSVLKILVRWTTEVSILNSTEAIFTYRVDETFFDIGIFCCLPDKLMLLL